MGCGCHLALLGVLGTQSGQPSGTLDRRVYRAASRALGRRSAALGHRAHALLLALLALLALVALLALPHLPLLLFHRLSLSLTPSLSLPFPVFDLFYDLLLSTEPT